MPKQPAANPYAKLATDGARRSPTTWLLLGGGIAVVVVALAALAVVLTRPDAGPVGDGSGAAAAGNATQEVASVTIAGEDLPPFRPTGDSFVADPSQDAAVGKRFPKLSGQTFDGTEVVIDPADGRAKAVVFVAHWCPHCQAEVPRIQEYLDAGRLPEGVDVYYVSTGVDADQPNYPVSRWIAREGVSVPVLLDDAASTAGAASGVAGYPAMVFVGADGTVASRSSGELPIEEFDAQVRGLVPTP